MAEEKIIGIDLGTTNSVVAVMEGGEVKVIPNQEGNRLTPTVVAFTDKGDRLVGDPAKRQAVTNPRRTIYSIKRFMGRRHNEVESEEKMVPYKIVGGPNDLVKVDIDGKELHAAGNLGDDPAQAQGGRRGLPRAQGPQGGHHRPGVLQRHPAAGDHGRRPDRRPRHRVGDRGPKDRQEVASSGCASSTSRPPPSLAYGLDKKKNEKIAVFDLGGGTFDISHPRRRRDGVFEVLVDQRRHAPGRRRLRPGADRLHRRRVQEGERHRPAQGPDGPAAAQGGRRAGQEGPVAARRTTDINLPFITADASGPKHLTMTITRAKFEQLIDHLIERCKRPVLTGAARTPSCKPSDIDEVVLVGGMTRMPRVQQLVKEIFGKEGHKGVNPDEVVAVGAAIQGAQLLLGSEVRRAAARRDAAVAGHRDHGRRA